MSMGFLLQIVKKYGDGYLRFNLFIQETERMFNLNNLIYLRKFCEIQDVKS